MVSMAFDAGELEITSEASSDLTLPSVTVRFQGRRGIQKDYRERLQLPDDGLKKLLRVSASKVLHSGSFSS